MNIKRLLGSILVGAFAVISFFGFEETKLNLFPNRGTLEEFSFADLQDVDFNEIFIRKTKYKEENIEEEYGSIKDITKVKEEINKLGKIDLLEVSLGKFAEEMNKEYDKSNNEKYSIEINGLREERIDHNKVYLREIKVKVEGFIDNNYIKLDVRIHGERGNVKHYKIEEGSIDYDYLDKFIKPRL